MPWRPLMRYLSNNEELIRRLSESYPIRRAAQLTAYFLNVGKDKFIEQRGKYERAGGWNKTKRDVKHDFKAVQDIGKEYISTLFRPYTDTWENYKELRRQQEKSQKSSSSTTTKATTKNKKPFS
ncbi:unnamed protein product [Rotaria sp. Silwood2]|nr:unnamed protein product [Rotaria sp. Silwood2]CAF2502724.1 unnamed protein product [Rotaria sp. Silwood2]CAF2816890.1 unnamed protein product [Rotaria sp. Silwood2]CAF2900391.1 unnamed protein product [Rotaria sp. Silwood2]CAF4307716.1 unnamed protein product [Rotaria sp. Silwood2]